MLIVGTSLCHRRPGPTTSPGPTAGLCTAGQGEPNSPCMKAQQANMSAGSADLCSSLPPTQPVLHLHRTERGCTVSATALAKQCWDDLRTRKTRGPPGCTSRIFQEKTFPRLESQQKNSAEFLLEVWKFKLVPGYQRNRETMTWKRIPGRRNTIVVCCCHCPLVRLTRDC